MKTAQQLYAEARGRVAEVTASETLKRMAGGEPIVLIDIREQNEWNLGHAEGAKYIGRGVLEREIEKEVPRDAPIVLYCANGNRSLLASATLAEMGYTNVASMAGGFRDWVAAGGAVED